jgi:hypothetical protein
MSNDFDIDLVFHDRSQFLDVHLEAAVAADRPHPFIGPGQLHADGHGQAQPMVPAPPEVNQLLVVWKL